MLWARFGGVQDAWTIVQPILKLMAAGVEAATSIAETANINREIILTEAHTSLANKELTRRVKAMGYALVDAWEVAGAPSDNGGGRGATVVNNFNHAVSRSDIANITAEQQRQAARN